MVSLSELDAGILKGFSRECPDRVRVFVPFPLGTTLEGAKEIERSLNPEPLEHHHIEEINGVFYLHVAPHAELAKYLKLKEKLKR